MSTNFTTRAKNCRFKSCDLTNCMTWLKVVPGAGVEPARTDKVRGILSPLCLPISPPGRWFGGAFQSRTGLYGFAIRCITALLTRRYTNHFNGAGNEVRTRDPNHGKVMLYQLSYSRVASSESHYKRKFLSVNKFF